MELYQKPVMKIVELGGGDVLTASCADCSNTRPCTYTEWWNDAKSRWGDGCDSDCQNHPYEHP